MEVIVSRNSLLHALQHARRVIIPKCEMTMFRNFVFTFPDDPKEATMTVHASNGEQWITETVLLDQPAIEPRPFAVYYSDLLPVIKKLDDQPLRLSVGEYQMTVIHACGSFHIPTPNQAQEFLAWHGPRPDADAADGYLLEYEAPCLRSVLGRCGYAMAHDELRPAMNGVYVNLTDEHADYVSSDGHKLVQVRKSPVLHGKYAMQVSFIIPLRVVEILLRILPRTGDVAIEYQKELIEERKHIRNGKEETEKVSVRKAQARIVIDERLAVTFWPVDSRYPAYWNVIPPSHLFKMSVDRRLLIKSLDRLTLFSSQSGLVVLTVSEDAALRLNAKDADYELAAEEKMPCEFSKIDGGTLCSPYKIGVKGVSLCEMLKVLQSEKVVLLMGEASRAVIVQPSSQPDTEELTMLLMPMIIQD